MRTLLLEPADVAEMHRIGELRAPAEACGVLLPTPHRGRRVWEMPNRSPEPHDSFTLLGSDMAIELHEWVHDPANDELWDDIAFWHTHPKGNVGPSRYDLENRIENLGNLVITICADGDAKATWY